MITIAIPTYNRGVILVETIERLLALTPPADELVIVLSLSEESANAVEGFLREWMAPDTTVAAMKAASAAPAALRVMVRKFIRSPPSSTDSRL